MPSLAPAPPHPSLVCPSRSLHRPSRLLLLPPIRIPSPRLGFSVSSSSSSSQSGRRRDRRGGGSELRCEDDDDDDLRPIPPPLTPSRLEEEIFEFMEQSANPMLFPTKQQLLDADRSDLVEAMAAQGGWFLYGWFWDDADYDDPGSTIPAPPHAPVESNPSPVESNPAPVESNPAQVPAPVGSTIRLHADDAGSTVPDSAAPASLERSMEREGGEESAGVEGMLARLEKERRWSYSSRRKGKGSGRRISKRNEEHDPGDKDVTDTRSSMPDMLRKSRLQRADFHASEFKGSILLSDAASEFKADEIFTNEGRKELEENVTSDVLVDDKMYKAAHNVKETDDGRNVPQEISRKQIHMHLQHLESKLNSVRNLLRSRSKNINSRKGQESSLMEMHRLSDTLEFRETEIMNARDQLRSTRAKLAALEGKRTLRIIEEQKLMPEKQSRLDASHKSFLLLHNTCIVWANSASEVLLVGSFDGWTSKRRMKRSPSGVFSVCLDLYPGRYEMKFIVDGVWTVDPLRPIVRNNGHENNLLVVT